MPPVETSVWQKIALIVSGCLLSLVILEVLLRIGGALFQLHADSYNKTSFSTDEIRILCIGESTTQTGNETAYPQQLEKLLNERSPHKKFKVINRGETAQTSRVLLSHLDGNLMRFRPHFVIGMIGINDKPETPGFISKGALDNFLNQFHVYRLFALLRQHMDRKWAESRLKAIAPEPSIPNNTLLAASPVSDHVNDEDLPDIIKKLASTEQILVQVKRQIADPSINESQKTELAKYIFVLNHLSAYYYRLIGMLAIANENYPDAEKALGAALSLAPEDPDTVIQSGRLLKLQGQLQMAIQFFERAAVLRPNDPTVLVEIARTHSLLGNIEKARQAFLSVAALHPTGDNHFLNQEAGTWLNQNIFPEDAKKVLLFAYTSKKQDYGVLAELASVSAKLGQTDQATLYSKEAEFFRKKSADLPPETISNYHEIVDRVAAAGAKMIIMQYPMRSIENLKKAFADTRGIIYVENRENFLAVLRYGDFSNYFADSFAGDFGHCTPAGNRVIAKNLAEVILRQVLSEQK
jgi:tetratricopeptide (TPR) repeat protein